MPTYVVGDIHGRSDLLRSLLPQLPVVAGDDVVFLGDYIDRGPDSKGVVETLLQFSARSEANVAFLLGNHEQWLLRSLHDHCRHSWLLGMHGVVTARSYCTSATQALEDAMEAAGARLILENLPLPYEALIDSMPTTHLDFFKGLVPFIRTADVVCVHAGVSVDYVSVECESETTLVWGDDDWWQTYRGKDTIVYGHWNNADRSRGQAEPLACNGTYGIDCVASGELMAVRFPDLAVWRSGEARAT